jgi:phage-related minor tail protein
VGYFDLATGQFTRGDDASRSGANAISTPIGVTVGSGSSAAGNDKGAEQLLQQQAAAQKQLEDFSDTRAKIAVQLTNELSLLGATTDEARRRLEFDIEVDAINTQNLQVKKDLAAIEEEITRLGGVAETSAIRRQVEREKEQALVNAQVKFEQEINDILIERARMMQGITQQVAAPTTFNELEQQNAQLREMLDTYPAIGQAADAAADLATRGMAEMIAGTKSAKEVFVDFLSGIANALIDTAKRMIAQYIAIGIARLFAGFSSPSSGGFDANAAGPFGGAGLSTAVNFQSFANGNAFGPNGITPFAKGGVVSSPTLFPFAKGTGLMGESGPEAIMPLKRGADGKLGVSVYDATRQAVAVADQGSALNESAEESQEAGATNASRTAADSTRETAGAIAATRLQVLQQQQAAAERHYETTRIEQMMGGSEIGSGGTNSTYGAIAATRMQVLQQQADGERRSEITRIEQMISKPARMDIRYESQVINSVEYVTREQAERLAAKSAERGRELAIGALQTSVRTRKRVGIA